MITRSLICKGNNHPLRCEDDLYVYENNNFILSFVFDGCSSGVDSHFSSTMFKKIIISFLPDLIKNKKNESTIDIAISVVTEFRVKLEQIINFLKLYDVYDEMLSTLCICVLNKTSKCCSVIICGDGVCYVDGNIYNKHDQDGNSVYYITSVTGSNEEELRKNIWNYILNDCFVLINVNIKNTISISTDGIDTFVTPQGINLSDEAKKLFFDDTFFMNNVHMLKRKYNLFLKRDEKPINIDDFSMVRIILDDNNQNNNV